MAKVVRSVYSSDMMMVTFDHQCGDYIPGQTLNINGRFFAIADADTETVSVLTRYGGPLDLPEGTEVNMVGPIGKGFPGYDSWDAVIICGGTATGVGFNLLNYRASRGLRTWFVSYNRGGNPLTVAINESSDKKGVESSIDWNTRELGRPDSPYSPFGVESFPEGTHVFVAGSKELFESCRDNAVKFGIDANNIKLNF